MGRKIMCALGHLHVVTNFARGFALSCRRVCTNPGLPRYLLFGEICSCHEAVIRPDQARYFSGATAEPVLGAGS